MTHLLRWLRDALYPWKCRHEYAPLMNLTHVHGSLWRCTRCGKSTEHPEPIEDAFMEGVPDECEKP